MTTPPVLTEPTPSPTPQVFLYNVPTADSFTASIASGSDGNIWFVEGVDTINQVGRVDVSTGAVTEFKLPPCVKSPEYIAKGSDGNVWFAAICIEPNPPYTTYPNWAVVSPSGAGTVINMMGAPGSAFHETLGPDGNVWFTMQQSNYVGKITPAGVATYYSLSTAANPRHSPNDIAVGPDGNMWITDSAGLLIDRITTKGIILNEYNVPSRTDGITAGPDGNMWFTDFDGDQIGHISMSGQVVVNQLNNYCADDNRIALVGPLNIITGPDHALWFTDAYADAVTRITTSGHQTWFCMPPTDSGPFDLTVGSDGNIWFTFPRLNEIGKINVGALFRLSASRRASAKISLTRMPHKIGTFQFMQQPNIPQR